MFGSQIRKCKKKYEMLCNESRELKNQYYNLLDVSGCEACETFFRGSVTSMVQRFSNCSQCEKYLPLNTLCLAIEEKDKEIDRYVESEYSKAVYEYYTSQNPMLIEESTGRDIPWSRVFDEEYERMSGTIRHSLVGIVSGEGRYRLKRK